MTDDEVNGAPVWLANFPTTPARITLTLVLMLATAGRYLVYGAPLETGATLVLGLTPWALWLLTLTAWAAVDVGQYVGKRFSDRELARAKATPAPSVTVTAPTASAGVSVAGDAEIAAPVRARPIVTGVTPAAGVAALAGQPAGQPVSTTPTSTAIARSPALEDTAHAFKLDVRAAHPTGEASDL